MSSTVAPIPARRAANAHGPRQGERRGGARIGPNAIIQTAEAVRARHGDAVADELLAASTPWRLSNLPAEMVDERDVNAFVRAVLERYAGREGSEILHEAGVRTADYLRQHRIPRLAQVVLGRLPRGLALRALMAAIAKHSWTFAGSAQFHVSRLTSRGGSFTLHACPICRGLQRHLPVCHYYAGTFEELLRRIIASEAVVREVECEAAGGACCRFVIEL